MSGQHETGAAFPKVTGPGLNFPFTYTLLRITVTKEVAELLKSNEARHHMGKAAKHAHRLSNFISEHNTGRKDVHVHEPNRSRHEALQRALDELVACYVSETRKGLENTTLMEFMEWAAAMTKDATCEGS